ncbi:MAG: hypothetical protein HQL33_00315 [Alphaproteobacteria bacterium]|nr:hypothetical protein [Alphaproteobacteria bacterium]
MAHLAIEAVYWCGVLIGLWAALRARRIDVGRNGAFLLGVLFVLASTYEFWILGSRSYLNFDIELDYSLSGRLALPARHGETQFVHGFSGGVDADAVAAFTGAYFSLNTFLLDALPVGLAAFVHKMLVIGGAFFGMYRLARGIPRMERNLAFAAAALYASHGLLAKTTWNYGPGYALIPLLCHVVVGRLDRRFYWPGVALAAVLYAAGSDPFHDFLALLPALAAVALLRGWGAVPRIVPSALLVVAAVVLNWHEGLYAKFLMGPLTVRGAPMALSEQVDLTVTFYTLLAALGLVLSVYGRKAVAVRSLVSFAFVSFGYVGLTHAVYHVEALSPLKSLTFGYMSQGEGIVSMLILGVGVREFAESGGVRLLQRVPRIAFALVAALATGAFFADRAFNSAVWLVEGGLSSFTAARTQLARPSWLPGEPVRTVTVPYRLAPNIAAAAGLDTFDGTHDLSAERYTRYWKHVAAGAPLYQTHPGLFSFGKQFAVCGDHDLGSYADLDLLRVANVGFVLSVVPLRGEGVRQVSGPSGPPRLPCPHLPVLERVARMAELIVAPAPIRVYAIGEPVPRVYAARTIETSRGEDEASFHARVKRRGPDRIAVARAEDLPATPIPSGSPLLSSWRLVADGVEAEVAGGGGLVVFNSTWLPFWSARADGNPTPVFPVNGVQMAAVVPEGTRRIEFRYRRPTLREWFKP